MAPQDAGQRRDELLAGAVDYVLDHGVAGLSLRPLAAALGTSDRMVLYYFGTREALIAAVLQTVADRLRAVFAALLPPEPQPPAAILTSALGVSDQPGSDRLLGVWLEVVSLAGSGEVVFAETAAAVVADWVEWVAARVAAPADQRRAVAAALLVIIDGMILFEAAGAREDAQAAAGWLMRALA